MNDPPPTRPALILAIAFALGAAGSAVLPLSWWVWALLAACCLLVALGTLARPVISHVSLWCAIAAFGSFWHAQHVLLPQHHISRFTFASPQTNLHGVVASDPVEILLPYREPRATWVVRADAVGTAAGWRRAAGLVRASASGLDVPVSYGDEVLVQGRLSAPAPPFRRGEFDYAAYLARRGIHAQLSVRAGGGLVRLRQHRGWPWVEAALRLKHAWRRIIDRSVRPQTRGLLSALLLGDRLALEDRLEQAFIATGTVHLLAISGFNVALLAWTLQLVLSRLRVSPRWRCVIIAGALGLYAVMTGFQPPVVRATVMAWVWLGGKWLERDVDVWQVLGVAAIVLLVMNPAQLADAGFQLSFASVAAIAYFVPRWQAVLPSSGVGRYLGQGMLVSTAAWLGVAPLVWYHFQLVTPLTIAANLVAVPLTEAILVLGLALGLAGWLWSEISLVLGGWCHLLLCALQGVVLHAAQWPGSVIRLGQPAAWMVAAWYAALAVTAERRRLRLAEVHLAMAGLVVLNGLLWWQVVR